MNYFSSFFLLSLTLFSLNACTQEALDSPEAPYAPYVLSLGITSNGTSTYYVVSTSDLMNGNINAVGKGIEQNGYQDYEQGQQTIFSIGGLGVTETRGIVRNASGYLEEQGRFVFNQNLSEFTQIDANTMLGLEIPSSPASGELMTFYVVDIASVSIRETRTSPIQPLAELEYPSISGMCLSGDKLFVSYFGMNPISYETPYTDTCYVAVYSYPALTLDTILKDARTGPAGSWAAHNGLLKTEGDDVYVMSNTAISNGYSQSTKHAAFLRIPQGKVGFDDYFFDFEALTGGLKPAHLKYLENGLVFAEVSTLNPQTADDRWADQSLKCCIIDLYNQRVTDVQGIPIHGGNGGRRFTALYDEGQVFFPVSTKEGTYIYRIDPQTAVAEKGAKVSTSFVGGLFKLNP